MSNAGDIIKDALQDLGVLSAGQTPSTADYTDCLRRLNRMLDSWSTSSLLVPFRTQISKILDGSESYTVGSGGDINTTRPHYIETAFVTKDTTDYPVEVCRDRGQYDRIFRKEITGIPRMVYYEPALPLGQLFVWYVGNAEYTLYLNVRGTLSSFPDTSTEVVLSEGYESAVSYNLSLLIAPMYETVASEEVIKAARETMGRIKRLNRQIPIMNYDRAIPAGRARFNIEAGE